MRYGFLSSYDFLEDFAKWLKSPKMKMWVDFAPSPNTKQLGFS